MKRLDYKLNYTLILLLIAVFSSSFVLPKNIIAGDPAYLAESWIKTGGPIGGLGYDIKYNYDDPNTWYVTDAWSGFYISTNSGLTWTPSNKGITARKGRDAIPVFCVTVDQHNPSTLWIGTEATGDLFRSTDGGYSWVEKTNGIDPNLQPLTFRGITIDPRSSDIIYAMGEIGSPGWTTDGNPVAGLELDLTQGVVYKTIDGGNNWKQIWRGNNLARYCWIDPRDPQVLYVSTGIFDREAANTDTAAGFAGGVGILKSTNGGETWRVLNQENGLLDLYVGSLFMHPENPDILLAAASQNNWSGYGDGYTGGVFLTENGGENWIRVLSQAELFAVVEYSTANPNIAYAASGAAFYRSEDAGHTWQRFSRANNTWGSPGNVVGFPIDLQCDPRDPMRVLVNNYLGGNFVSTDGGATWELASKGYTGALVHHLSVIPGHAEKIFTGSRSGIYRSNNGGENWIGLVYTPEGMSAKFNEIITLAVDPNNPQHVLTVANDFMTVLITYNGGYEWKIGTILGGATKLVFAPSSPSMVYAASDHGFFVSTNGGDSFVKVGTEQMLEEIETITVHPNDQKIVYISTESFGLFKSDDGGQNWNSLGQGFPSYPARSLVIDPSNPDIIFAGVSTENPLGGQGIYRSSDGGLTWAQSGIGMEPNALVTSIAIDPTNTQIVYAADNLSGVYVSTNGGSTWQGINNGLDYRTMNVLALSDDGSVLYAATEGAGVYRLGDLPATTVNHVQGSLPENFRLAQNYPNPFNPETTIEFNVKEKCFVMLKIFDITGREVATLINSYFETGFHQVKYDASDLASGVYLYRIQMKNFSDVKKMVLLK